MRKTKEENFIEKIANSVKNPEEAVEVVDNMEKVIKSNKCSILWLAYQRSQIFKKFKVNENFIDMVK